MPCVCCRRRTDGCERCRTHTTTPTLPCQASENRRRKDSLASPAPTTAFPDRVFRRVRRAPQVAVGGSREPLDLTTNMAPVEAPCLLSKLLEYVPIRAH